MAPEHDQQNNAETDRAKKKKVQRGQPKASDDLGMNVTGGDPQSGVYDEYRDAADTAEQAQKEELRVASQRPETTPLVFKIGNSRERTDAQKLIDEINGYREHLIAGIRDGQIESSALKANTDTVLALGDFLVSAGDEGRTVGDFQKAYAVAKGDLARFTAQVALLQKQNPGIGDVVSDWGGEKALQKQANNVKEGGPHLEAMQSEHQQLEEHVGKANSAQQHVRECANTISAALNHIAHGVVATKQQDVEGSDVLERVTKIKSVVGAVLDDGVDSATEELKIPGKGIIKKALDAGADAVVEACFGPDLRELESKTGERDAKQEHGGTRSQVVELRGDMAKWAQAVIDFRTAQQSIATLKQNMRNSARMFSAKAENSGEFASSVVAQLFAEADTLLEQVNLTIGLGNAEGSSAGDANKDRTHLLGGNGLVYYRPEKTYEHKITYEAVARHVYFATEGAGRSAGGEGSNPVIAASLADLSSAREQIRAIRDRLAGALGYGKASNAVITEGAGQGPQ